jgi:hypothetical protein
MMTIASLGLPRITSNVGVPHMTFEASGSSGDADLESTTDIAPILTVTKRARRCSGNSSDGDHCVCCNNHNNGSAAHHNHNGGHISSPPTEKDDDIDPTEPPECPICKGKLVQARQYACHQHVACLRCIQKDLDVHLV